MTLKVTQGNRSWRDLMGHVDRQDTRLTAFFQDILHKPASKMVNGKPFWKQEMMV